MTTITKRRAEAAVPFWQLLVTGVVTFLFGVALLIEPGVTLRVLGVLAGAWLIVLGVMRLFGVFNRGHGLTQQVLDGALGVILLVAGFSCLRNAAAGAVALSIIIGLAWLLSGFAELLIGTMSRGRHRLWLFVLAGASIVVGLVFLIWPGLSVTALVLLTAITALVLGAGEIVVAFEARHAGHHPAQP